MKIIGNKFIKIFFMVAQDVYGIYVYERSGKIQITFKFLFTMKNIYFCH